MTGARHAPYPLSAKIGPDPLTVGRAPDVKLRLLESTISRRHARLTRNNGVVEVNDQESRFGTFVNGDRIRTISLRSGDRVRFGSVVTYRLHGDGLELEESGRGIGLSVSHLSLSRSDRLLLDDINVRFAADAFIGILGPSGAGKSTLLNCLATYLEPDDGEIVFDDECELRSHLDEYRTMLGHVPQENLVYKILTAEENLVYAARLRFDRAVSDAEIADEVDRVLEEVGLTEHAEKQVCVLSGGQRKRLSVAIELLKRPRLLLLDEPTSGLDPAAEATLMEEFRHIARRGTTVLCTTHMMDNLHLFDRVICLGISAGSARLAYAGPPEELFETFGCKDFAGLYEKLQAGSFKPIADPAILGEARRPAPQPVSPDNPLSSSRSHLVETVSQAAGEIADFVESASEAHARRQLRPLLQRAGTLSVRDRGLLWAILLQPIGLGLLNCLSQSIEIHIAPMLFFLVVIAIWLGLNNSARDIVRERKLYIRERLAGLKPGAYLASKIVAHLCVGALQLILLLAVFRVSLSLLPMRESALTHESSDISLLWTFCVLISTYTGSLGIGLLLSTIVRTEEQAVAALPLLIMPQILISAIATGQVVDVFYRGPKYLQEHSGGLPFLPLAIKLRHPHWDSVIDCFLDFLSLGCLSRPASLLVNRPSAASELTLVLDFAHLCILILGTWIVTIYVFRREERKWPRLIGIG